MLRCYKLRMHFQSVAQRYRIHNKPHHPPCRKATKSAALAYWSWLVTNTRVWDARAPMMHCLQAGMVAVFEAEVGPVHSNTQ